VSLIIDPLSVATQGFLETPSTPNVEAKRDALRVATLGWIILDFSLLPDPDQDSDARIVNPCTDALIVDGSTTFAARQYEFTATIEDGETDADVVVVLTGAEIEDASTDATVPQFKSTMARAERRPRRSKTRRMTDG
jgi:hypothetical protein